VPGFHRPLILLFSPMPGRDLSVLAELGNKAQASPISSLQINPRRSGMRALFFKTWPKSDQELSSMTFKSSCRTQESNSLDSEELERARIFAAFMGGACRAVDQKV